ncbi:MAG: GTP diphosphokinase [Gammaproteobacteria bacterium]|nr:GTP diphosphokinase [Gammaproteobacteria bacterium]
MVSTSSTHPQIAANSPDNLNSWLQALSSSRSDKDTEIIKKACNFSQQAHEGQHRASGEPYFYHSLAVANILVELKLDADTICAAILHDVVEDTDISIDDIQNEFGSAIAQLVNGVTKMDIISTIRASELEEHSENFQAENLRKMLLAMAEDVRVVLIKLADRLHNMRTLSALSESKQQRIAQETMDIFAPLANRLGIWGVKWELEDLSFRYLNPIAYKQIANSLAERRVAREQYINQFVKTLQNELDTINIKADVQGRAKHIYGIWKKMQHKQQEFHKIYDIRAVRVYVETIPECYTVLGVVHSLWNYLSGEFDDYIATPKENNYRSIHTAVLGPEGKTVEVQIRTWDMHRESEYGIAAHWRYKEGAKTDSSFDEKIVWLRQLLEWKDDVAEATDFVDQFKSEVFSDRIYVFTPQGNIVDLPTGATPLDFAYRIHTEVGHRCRGAKVNDRMVQLTHKLQTGDQIEILTIKKGTPSRDWMNPHLGYLITSKARQKVQHWFKLQNTEQNISDGRTIIDRELKRMNFTDISYDKIAKKLNLKNTDALLNALGSGDIKPARIVHIAQQITAPDEILQSDKPISYRAEKKDEQTDIKVDGVGDLLTKFARCCKPVPGDPIIGFITQGRGVTIHRRDCHNVLRSISQQPERFVEVSWGNDSSKNYTVDITIYAYDRKGLLKDVTTLLLNEGVNVIAINTQSHRKTHTVTMNITLEIPDLETLSKILAKASQLPNITEVKRKNP